MRVEVKTCSNVRIMLDLETVRKQRLIISENRCHCQVILKNGKTLDIEKAIPNFDLEPNIDITKKEKNKFIQRLKDHTVFVP